MNIVIKAERVRLLRESKKMSQAALANATRLGKRQIQRIEQHEGELPVRENTLNKLAKGLRVNPRVLTGEELMPESTVSDHIGVSAQSSVKTIKLSPHVQLQYDLIKEVYGGTFEDLVSLAPILFTQLAEQSLAWREKEFNDKVKRTAEIIDFGRRFPKFGKLVGDTSEEWGGFLSGEGSAEYDSIATRDVFGEQLIEDCDPGWDRPYVQYLKSTLDGAQWSGKVEFVQMEGAPHGTSEYLDGFRVPYTRICNSDLQQITGCLPDALFALEMGLVRIDDIPPELMGAEKTPERSTWIAAHLKTNPQKEV